LGWLIEDSDKPIAFVFADILGWLLVLGIIKLVWWIFKGFILKDEKD